MKTKIVLILSAVIFTVIITKVTSSVKYELACNPILLSVSEKVAIEQVGITERTGKNDNPRIDEYLLGVGLSRGNPYCAAGIYWCFSEACRRMNLPYSEIPIPRTGLANAIFAFSVKNGRKTGYRAARHDLITWRKPNTFYGHIERILKTEKAGWIITIGFNTTPDNGPQNIQGVFIKKRNIYHPLKRMVIRGLTGFYYMNNQGILK